MKDVKRDFNTRKDEINTYLFLEKHISIKTISWDGKSQEKVSRELKDIMKANIFLMLYNLVESSISDAIEQIYISISNENISFDDIKEGIKTKLIRYLKNKKKADDFVKNTNSISIDIISSCFEKNDIFSGNADRDRITKLARQYGFSFNSDYMKTKHGEKLQIVRKNRNELAHGVFSFRKIGSKYPLSDIRQCKNETIAYLEQIIENIEKYINEKSYKSVE